MKKTKIGLNDIVDAHPEMDYLQLYEYIMQMVDIIAMKSRQRHAFNIQTAMIILKSLMTVSLQNIMGISPIYMSLKQ